jgi:tRNA A37 threonylcarbamoyladenosine synthetase subunit TsaC/SUA5/YrdC
MTIRPIDDVATVATALRRGEAVLVPFPSPLPYAVAATTAAAVNEAKGRPPDQPCGILLASADDVLPHVDLDRATADLARWLGEIEQANLFLPLRPGAPDWLAASAVDGIVGITLAWLTQTRPLAGEFGHLWVSSANRTAGPVGVTAPEVDTIFAGERLVLDGDAVRDASPAHGSAPITEVGRHGRLRVARDGVNNRDLAADHAAYLAGLRTRYATAVST